MTFSSLYQLLTDFYKHALGMSIILGLFSACSGDNTDAELAENTKVIDQNFIKSLIHTDADVGCYKVFIVKQAE